MGINIMNPNKMHQYETNVQSLQACFGRLFCAICFLLLFLVKAIGCNIQHIFSNTANFLL